MSTESELQRSQERSQRLADALAGTRFGVPRWVDATGSTNADLARVADGGGPEQALVTDLQTAGRGRRGRVWTAPAESAVLMSILIRDRDDVAPFWTVGAVAVAAAEAITQRIDDRCELKWPNDLLIAGSKVAGILAQGAGGGIIVGAGINMNWGPEAPAGVPETATSVNRHLASSDQTGVVDRVEFVIDVLSRVERVLDQPLSERRRNWVERCATVGSEVRVDLDPGGNESPSELRGKVVDIAEDGGLVLDTGSDRVVVHVGDVVHLRANS